MPSFILSSMRVVVFHRDSVHGSPSSSCSPGLQGGGNFSEGTCTESPQTSPFTKQLLPSVHVHLTGQGCIECRTRDVKKQCMPSSENNPLHCRFCPGCLSENLNVFHWTEWRQESLKKWHHHKTMHAGSTCRTASMITDQIENSWCFHWEDFNP